MLPALVLICAALVAMFAVLVAMFAVLVAMFAVLVAMFAVLVAMFAVLVAMLVVNRTPCQGQFLKVGPLVLDSSTILVPLKWTFGNCLSEGP
jgi:uncharacterized membrane protein